MFTKQPYNTICHMSFPILLPALALLTISITSCSKHSTPVEAPLPVFVTTLGGDNNADARALFGSVQPRYQSSLSFRASGKIIRRRVDVGDHVAAGQVLAELDPADYQLAANAAKDQLKAAQINAQQAASDEARFRRLMVSGAVGTADHERQKARADAAAAMQSQAAQNLALANNKLSYLNLRAPNAGTITLLNMEVGQLVAEGTPVAQLAQQNTMEIVCDIPESLVNDIKNWQATADVLDSNSHMLNLTLREVSPVASAAGKTFQAKYAIAGGDSAVIAGLKQGQSMGITLTQKMVDSSNKIAASAVIQNNSGTFVWAVNTQNHLTLQPVNILKYTNDSVYISGLNKGIRIVTAGVHKLQNNMLVKPIERSMHGELHNQAYGISVEMTKSAGVGAP